MKFQTQIGNAIPGKGVPFLVFTHLGVFIKEDAKIQAIILMLMMDVFVTGRQNKTGKWK